MLDCGDVAGKLNEIEHALDSRRIELARLQDRFPYPIDLKQSDISEVTSKRVLYKNPTGADVLGALFGQHEGRLKTLCTLERTSRSAEITRESFVHLYPYLPYQIDLCIALYRAYGCAGAPSDTSAVATAPSSNRPSRCWCIHRLTWRLSPLEAW